MIRGRVRTLNKLNSPLIVARMKKYLLPKVYAFRFRRRRFFYRRTNKTATLNVSILYIVALSLTCNSSLRCVRCVRCVVKETAPKTSDNKQISKFVINITYRVSVEGASMLQEPVHQ